ncbi:hypothetical protein DRP04_05675 [Archaeoglobales archaeon]|nr:MAG: hypothetical protein DRP04_05675 [Archaeoglobales archaeon]
MVMPSILNSISGLIKHKLWREDLHFPMVVVGDPGVGKSSTSLTLANAVDETFTIDRVVFKPTEFFEVAREVERGQAMIFDEAGIGLHVREWQSITNIIFSKLTQVYRFLNVFVVFTVPDITYIDSHARNEMKAILDCKKKDLEREVVIGHWWVVFRSRVFGTTTLEKLKLYGNDGQEIVVDPVEFPRPPERLWLAYKRKSEKYKRRVIDELYDELQKLEDGVIGNKIDGHALRRLMRQEQALMRMYEYMSNRLGMSDREIAGIMGVSPPTLINWKAAWRPKELAANS